MAEQKPPRMGPRDHARFVPDHKDFGKFIRSAQVRDVTAEVAKDIASRAAKLAPRRKSGVPPDGTSMADQFRVDKAAGFIKVSGNVRVKVNVFNSARSAAPNEFGGKRNTRHRMLGRAGAEFGDFKGKGAEEFL